MVSLIHLACFLDLASRSASSVISLYIKVKTKVAYLKVRGDLFKLLAHLKYEVLVNPHEVWVASPSDGCLDDGTLNEEVI